MTVTIYELPNCSMCRATKQHFDRLGVSYEVVNFMDDIEKAKEFVNAGHKSAPVVTVGERMWSGYKPEEIIKTAQDLRDNG